LESGSTTIARLRDHYESNMVISKQLKRFKRDRSERERRSKKKKLSYRERRRKPRNKKQILKI